MQKGIYEYSRARAGHYAKVLFAEQEFMRRGRPVALARLFPLGLAMVGEAVEGVLRPHAADPALQLERLTHLVLSIFDRYPTPPALGLEVWRDSRAELSQRLRSLGLHPPKRVKDIPEPYAEIYWNLMPIEKEVRSADFPTTRSYLTITLCNIHDELTSRSNLPLLAASLNQFETPEADPQAAAH